MSASLEYVGASLPHLETVQVGNEQQAINITTSKQVIQVSTAVGVYLLENEASLWKAAEGWTPPPVEPAPESVQIVTGAYTLKGGNDTVIGIGTLAITVPDATVWDGKKWTVKAGTEASVLTLSLANAANKFVENLNEVTSIKLSKAATFNSVSITAKGGKWYVV